MPSLYQSAGLSAGGLFYLPPTTRIPDGYGTITHLSPLTSSGSCVI